MATGQSEGGTVKQFAALPPLHAWVGPLNGMGWFDRYSQGVGLGMPGDNVLENSWQKRAT